MDSKFQASTSTASPPISSVFMNPPRKVNESFHEVHTPNRSPRMQILFFHGLQFLDSSENHFWTTWESEDKSCIWPEKWLVEDFPDAQIYFVSYGARLKKRDRDSLDMYLTTENLISDLMGVEDIGKHRNCSLVLVGHCFGGVVIKDLCVTVQKQLGLAKKTEKAKLVKLQNFLDNIKGIFFYSTPHHGIPFLEEELDVKDDPLLAYFQTLSNKRERLNFEFSRLREKFDKWRIHGLGAIKPTKLGESRDVIIVPESFGREGSCFNVMEVDHFSVSKPRDKTSRSFYAFRYLLEAIATDNEQVVHQVQGIPEYHPGLERRAFEVQEKLRSGEIVGIVGRGGIGKSTIAMQVFNNISRDFKYTCFVRNVKGIQNLEENDGLRLRNHFHSDGMQAEVNKTEWYCLKDEKTLLVMDDVDSVAQLKILPNLRSFGDGSRLIITTRNRSILNCYPNNKWKCYDVECLEDAEAEELFRCLASGTGVLEEQYVKTMVEKCEGLPLTLEVMGCYFRSHDGAAASLEQTIEKLENTQVTGRTDDGKARASLRVCFDALRKDEREIFIEAATLFFGDPVDEAVAAWSTTYQRSETSWANLVKRAMVKLEYKTRPCFSDPIQMNLFGKSRQDETIACVWVHEQLREMAKSLQESSMESSEEFDESLDSGDASEVKSIMYLRLYGHAEYATPFGRRYSKKLNLNDLDKAENLRYLELNGVRYEGKGKKFPSKLSLFRWRGGIRLFKWRRKFPISLEKMMNLAVLDLANWNTPKEFPDALKKLSKLHILRLVDLPRLDHLPTDFGNLFGLKELDLDSLSILALPSSFGNLPALELLSLRSLKISELPDSFGNLSSLRRLSIFGCGKLKGLPRSFGNLSSLVSLSIEDCLELSSLPEAFGGLSTLKWLSLTRLRVWELPKSFGNLCSLVRLIIVRCHYLGRLPSSFGRLSLLKELWICSCDSLEDLGGSFRDLSGLAYWNLQFCPTLERVFIRSALEELVLADNTQLRLGSGFGFLASHTKEVWDAERLKLLSDRFGDICVMESSTTERDPRFRFIPGLAELGYVSAYNVYAFFLYLKIDSGSERKASLRAAIPGFLALFGWFTQFLLCFYFIFRYWDYCSCGFKWILLISLPYLLPPIRQQLFNSEERELEARLDSEEMGNSEELEFEALVGPEERGHSEERELEALIETSIM